MAKSPTRIAVVIPVLNEAERLSHLLDRLEPFRASVLFVDGGSSDDTKQLCQSMGFTVVNASSGRARQMNFGSAQIEADVYWFLHADCIPPDDALQLIQQAVGNGYAWGRFDVRLTGGAMIYRVIERMMNWRSCITQVATGDQGLFVTSGLYKETGGFPVIPLMEDIAISKLLRRHSRGACIKAVLRVSSRRWETRGVLRTMLQMWWLRLRYFLGADPAVLHRAYYG